MLGGAVDFPAESRVLYPSSIRVKQKVYMLNLELYQLQSDVQVLQVSATSSLIIHATERRTCVDKSLEPLLS